MQIESLINEYLVEDDTRACEQTAAKIANSVTLVTFVRALENPLTQDDSLVRCKATQCLKDVLKQREDLNRKEIQTLLIFLSDRLHDGDSVAAAATGLMALAEKAQYSSPEDSSPFWAKLKDLDMLNMNAEGRYEIYRLLKRLADWPNDGFVDTFVALASGEKDPRNLLQNLKTSRQVLKSLGLSLSSERRAEIFDITFCYFPIKFNPPKDMPYTITAEELKDTLRLTLSRSELAEWAIPSLISKLAAVNIGVKLDALAALSCTIDELKKSSLLHSHWRSIWDGVKYEILHGTPDSETFGPVANIISKLVDTEGCIEELLIEIDNTTQNRKKFVQMCHLIVNISHDEAVWTTLASRAIEKAQDDPTILDIFLRKDYPVPHSDQVFQAFSVALSNGEKRESLAGLTRLATNPNGLEYAPLIVQMLTNEAAYSNLATLAAKYPSEIKDYCLPRLLNELPEALPALGEICNSRPLVHALSVRLLSRLQLSGSGQVASLRPLDLLQTLIAATDHLDENTDFVGYDRILLPSLFEAFGHDGKANIEANEDLTNAACILIERAARGILPDRETSYSQEIRKNVDKVPFPFILSAVAPLKNFPFEAGFLKAYAIPKFESSSGVLERAAYLRLLSLAANKWAKDLLPELDVKSFTDELRPKVRKNDNDCIEIFTWITKGMIARMDSAGFENAAFLTELATSSLQVAKPYGVLAVEDRILAKANGYVLRPLYRQKLFVQSLPVLSAARESRSTLVALGGLLKQTPSQVLSSHLDELLPMLMTSLSTSIESLQETVITCLSALLPQATDRLELHLDELIHRLLAIAATATTADLRATALKTIIALHDAAPETARGYSEEIFDKCAPMVGDKKREVRKYAVKCRQLFS